jgi:hypothetical protein
MPIAHVALPVLLFWSSLHGIRLVLNRVQRHAALPWNLSQSRSRFNSHIQVSLQHVHLQAQTTACNSVHDNFIHFISSRRGKKYKVVLSWLYKLGYCFAILGMIGTTLLLFWTCWLLLWRFFNQETPSAPTHFKRDTEHNRSQPRDWPIITPIVSKFSINLLSTQQHFRSRALLRHCPTYRS